MSALTAAFVILGASAGAAARLLVSRWLTREGTVGERFPVATLLVNLTGSFVLGVLIGLASTPVVGAVYMLALAGTGFCGALTTMSTFSLETVALLRERRWVTAGLYLAVSVTGGVLAILLGSRGVTQLL